MHPAQHHVTATKKRQAAWVEGRARGGKLDRPGRKRADGGAANDNPTPVVKPLTPDEFDARLRSLDWSQAAMREKRQKPEAPENRARGGLVGGTSEGRDEQSTSTPPEPHERLGRKGGGRATAGKE